MKTAKLFLSILLIVFFVGLFWFTFLQLMDSISGHNVEEDEFLTKFNAFDNYSAA